MNLVLAKQVDERIVKFLVDQCEFPPFLSTKDIPQWQLEAEERLHQKLLELFNPLLNKILDQIKQDGIPVDDATRQAIIEEIFGGKEEEFTETVIDESKESATHGRHSVENELKLFGYSVTYTDFNTNALEKLRNLTFTASQDTMSRLKGDIVSELVKCYEEGLGIDDSAVRLRQVFDSMKDYRLRLIARTEIQGAQNWGAYETMKDYQVEYRQWLTARDSRVRGKDPKDKADHIHLHGCVIRLGETYPNGLKYPGDRSGPIEEWINCRCRERPYIPRKNEIITHTPYWP